MSHHSLYDEDILLWSEQQAEAIRRLGRVGADLPNELDIANVAEEIESVGRSELTAVESYLQLILVHLIKLHVEQGSPAARHWRSEVFAFATDARRRYSPSMRQRIDMNSLWRLACEQSLLAYDGAQSQIIADLPRVCPLALDDLVSETIDAIEWEERLRNFGQR